MKMDRIPYNVKPVGSYEEMKDSMASIVNPNAADVTV
jgi:hypothetical protein